MIHLLPNLVAVSLPSRMRALHRLWVNTQNLGSLDDVDVILKHGSGLV